METQQISKFQFFTIVMSYILANDIVRTIYYHDHKNNTWILALLGIFTSIMIVFIYLLLFKNIKGLSFTNTIEKILGKYLSKIIFIIYPIYFVFTASLNLRDIMQLVELYLIDQAPIWIIGLLLMLVILYSLNHGIEVFGRVNTIFFYIHQFIFIVISYFVISFNEPKFERLIPTFDHGIKPLLIDSLKYSYAVPYGELFVLLTIFPLINIKKGANKIFYICLINTGLMFLVLTIMNIILIPPESVIVDWSTTLRVTRIIDIELIIQRVDLLAINLIVLVIFTKLTVLLYASTNLLEKVIKVKKKNIIHLILCLLTVYLSIKVSDNYTELIIFRKNIMFNIIRLIFEIMIPFSLVFLSFFRRPKKQKEQNTDQHNRKKDQDIKNDEQNMDKYNDTLQKDKNFLTNLKDQYKQKVLKK